MEIAEVAALGKQVANVTESKRSIGSLVVVLYQLFECFRLIVEALSIQFLIEKISELLFGRIEDFNFVWNSA